MGLFTPAPDTRLRIVLNVIPRRSREGVAGVVGSNHGAVALVGNMGSGRVAPLGNFVPQFTNQTTRGGKGQVPADCWRGVWFGLSVDVKDAAQRELGGATVRAAEAQGPRLGT